MADQQRTNDPGIANCQVSLICFTLTDPNGAISNYYSGLVDLPADTTGVWDNYSLDNSSPDYNDPITYDPDSNTFTVAYSIAESLYNANGTYKTFMLPFYTDQAELSANIQMNVTVNINLTNDQGVSNTIKKLGTVSTVRVVKGNFGPPDPPSLDLIHYIPSGNPEGQNCWDGIIKSCTQPAQYFIILWSCIPQTTAIVWPLMWKPNASVGDPGTSSGGQIVCNWWNWDESPAVNRGIPEPNPALPYTTIIGSIEATDQQYSTAALEGNDPGPDFSAYYQYAIPM